MKKSVFYKKIIPEPINRRNHYRERPRCRKRVKEIIYERLGNPNKEFVFIDKEKIKDVLVSVAKGYVKGCRYSDGLRIQAKIMLNEMEDIDFNISEWN